MNHRTRSLTMVLAVGLIAVAAVAAANGVANLQRSSDIDAAVAAGAPPADHVMTLSASAPMTEISVVNYEKLHTDHIALSNVASAVQRTADLSSRFQRVAATSALNHRSTPSSLGSNTPTPINRDASPYAAAAPRSSHVVPVVLERSNDSRITHPDSAAESPMNYQEMRILT